MIVLVFLQLTPGVFLVFYHYARGKNSKRQASDLAMYFILGILVAATTMLVITYLTFFEIAATKWIMSGILMALAMASFWFYFRKGEETELFLTRKVAKSLTQSAINAKNRSDVFLVGLIANTLEIMFTLPLYIVVAMTAGADFSHEAQVGIMVIAVIMSVIPVIVLKIRMDRGRNLAEIQRGRVRSKQFDRLMISVCYFVMAIMIISLELRG